MGLYQKLVPVGIGLTISGVVFGQVPYTHATLFGQPTDADFQEALVHYQRWHAIPSSLYYLMYAIVIVGFIGLLILVYKPSSSLKLYDYTSLGVYFLTLCVFITNIKTGIDAAVYDTWGEVDMPMGINVIGATFVMIVIMLIGVLVLQAGRYYQILEDERAEEEYIKLSEQAKKEEQEKLAKEKEEQEKQAKKDARNAKKYGHEDGLKQRKNK